VYLIIICTYNFQDNRTWSLLHKDEKARDVEKCFETLRDGNYRGLSEVWMEVYKIES
jgi:hypothetical protein